MALFGKGKGYMALSNDLNNKKMYLLPSHLKTGEALGSHGFIFFLPNTTDQNKAVQNVQTTQIQNTISMEDHLFSIDIVE